MMLYGVKEVTKTAHLNDSGNYECVPVMSFMLSACYRQIYVIIHIHMFCAFFRARGWDAAWVLPHYMRTQDFLAILLDTAVYVCHTQQCLA